MKPSKIWMTAALLACVGCSSPLSAAPEAPVPPPGFEFGEYPDWDRIRAKIDDRIRASLFDPRTAQIEWPVGFKQGSWRLFLKPRIWGYVTCGTYNAKNRMGGYAGRQTFVVIVHNGAIVYFDDTVGLVDAQCKILSPFPLPPGAVTTFGYGFSSKQIEGGALVSSVVTGGAASLAGLRPGMVVVEINGIPLRGLTQEVAGKIIGATQGVTTFTIAGGQEIKMGKGAIPTKPNE